MCHEMNEARAMRMFDAPFGGGVRWRLDLNTICSLQLHENSPRYPWGIEGPCLYITADGGHGSSGDYIFSHAEEGG